MLEHARDGIVNSLRRPDAARPARARHVRHRQDDETAAVAETGRHSDDPMLARCRGEALSNAFAVRAV
jgi:hypothetical protein